MIIKWDGRDWSYDPQALTTRDAATIRDHTGYGALAWARAVNEWDGRAVEGLVWVMRRQNGVECDIESIDVPIAAFMDAVSDAQVKASKRKAPAPKAKARTGRSGRPGSSAAAPTD